MVLKLTDWRTKTLSFSLISWLSSSVGSWPGWWQTNGLFYTTGWRNSMRLNRGTSVFCNSESKTNFTLWTQQGGARINTLIQWFTVTCLGCYVLVVATEWEPGKTKSVIREWVWRQPFTACETRNVAEEDTAFSSMRSKQIILSLFWEMTNNDNKKYYIQFSQLLYV